MYQPLVCQLFLFLLDFSPFEYYNVTLVQSHLLVVYFSLHFVLQRLGQLYFFPDNQKQMNLGLYFKTKMVENRLLNNSELVLRMLANQNA